MGYLSGHCGITLVRSGSSDDMKRVTYREESHHNCTGVYADVRCSCTCHSNGSPWDEIGTLTSKGRMVAPMLGRSPKAPSRSRAAKKQQQTTDLRKAMQELVDSIDLETDQEQNNG